MAWRCGCISRSLISTSRASSIRSSLPRLRPSLPPLHAPRRSLFTIPRTVETLACMQSLMPLHTVVVADTRLTSHISAEARTCCELSQGT